MPEFKNGVQREFYKQGSECCRNYSPLTQRTRTLALIAAVAAVAAPLSNLVDIGKLNDVVRPMGILLMGIALSLGLVDWHYQSAFEAIRDLLARLEASLGEEGPWRAHFAARGSWPDFIASYLPFGLLFALGAIAAGLTIPDVGSLELNDVEPWALWVVVVEVIAGLILTGWSLGKHENAKDKISALLEENNRAVKNSRAQNAETELSNKESVPSPAIPE